MFGRATIRLGIGPHSSSWIILVVTLATSLKLVNFSVSEVVTNKHSNYSQTKSWCSHNSHRQKCMSAFTTMTASYLPIYCSRLVHENS